MEIVLGTVIVILLLLMGILYYRTSRIMKSIDDMLEAAIENTFMEKHYSESRLSKLEAKMYRYLLSGVTAKRQITTEKDRVKMLVSDISHQTKTPIANILLYTELLKEQVLEQKSEYMVSQIEEQTEKLNFLVQSLVKTSRLENGIVAPVIKENKIKELIDSVTDSAVTKEKHITILVDEIQAELTAFFDRKWTQEALDNIVDNAIKYTPEGGQIWISAKEYEMFVRVDITDTGIGIAEEETARIFQRFYRSPAVSEEKGVGIGLYLAREIISKEGGYIKVTSESGKGSTFSIFLSKKPILSKLS